MIKWHLETRKISELSPHPSNPRKLTKEQHAQLKKSLDKFGLIDKPIVTQEGQILGGHQRLRILKEEGYKEIECWIPDREMTEHEIDELLIRLNKNTGEWDWDAMGNEWEVPDLLDWGFSADDLHIDTDDDDDKPKKKEKLCPHCGEPL
jgi:ParB-like chromosome segregation protein Spo0J